VSLGQINIVNLLKSTNRVSKIKLPLGAYMTELHKEHFEKKRLELCEDQESYCGKDFSDIDFEPPQKFTWLDTKIGIVLTVIVWCGILYSMYISFMRALANQ
jgi:hypothetical protein